MRTDVRINPQAPFPVSLNAWKYTSRRTIILECVGDDGKMSQPRGPLHCGGYRSLFLGSDELIPVSAADKSPNSFFGDCRFPTWHFSHAIWRGLCPNDQTCYGLYCSGPEPSASYAQACVEPERTAQGSYSAKAFQSPAAIGRPDSGLWPKITGHRVVHDQSLPESGDEPSFSSFQIACGGDVAAIPWVAHVIEGHCRLTGIGEVIAVKGGYRRVGKRSRVGV